MIQEKVFLENFKISVLKNKISLYVYIYNNTFYCLLRLNNTVNLKIISNKYVNLKHNLFKEALNKDIKDFLLQFYFYHFVKIKFAGKGYKIKKNTKQSMLLLFNRAHTTTIWWRKISIKRLRKYKIYMKCNYNFRVIQEQILSIRYVNIFTKKGLRMSRQILMKKKGKK